MPALERNALGERKTLARNADTVEQDMIDKKLDFRWQLADGTNVLFGDLTGDEHFF